MTTIRDIAKSAGVSQGTVSNVLNGKGNVSVEKINLVMQAASKLGYHVNEKAQSLRKGVSMNVAFVTPTLHHSGILDLYSVLCKLLKKNDYSIQLFVTNDIPEIEKEIISKIQQTLYDAIIVISCLENADLYYSTHFSRNTKLIFLLRSNNTAYPYFGFDNDEMGRKIASYCNKHHFLHIGMLTTGDKYSNSGDFIHSFINEYDGSLNIIEADFSNVANESFKLANDDYDAIISQNSYFSKALRNAFFYSAKQPGKLIEISSKNGFEDEQTICYKCDYYRLGTNVVSLILDSEKSENKVIIPTDGFPFSGYSKFISDSCQLNILTVDNPTSRALKKIVPLFTKQTGVEVNLQLSPYEDVYTGITALGQNGLYDIIRLDVAWLNTLAERVLIPLQEINADLKSITDNIIPDLCDSYCVVNKKMYCIPFDPSVQLIYYRKDLFGDPVIKRMYYENFKEELLIPEDYDKLNKVASFFTKSINPNSPTEYGLTMVAGNSTMASCELIPRIFAYYGSNYSGQISLTSEAAERALKNYIETAKYSKSINYQWWSEAVSDFASGDTAMSIEFSNYASNIVLDPSSRVTGKIGFAPVPGSKPLLGGGVMGISIASNHKKEALLFLNWIMQKSIASALTSLSGVSGNKSVYEDYFLMNRFPWLNTTKNSFKDGIRRENWLVGSHSLEERKIEKILGLAIKNALTFNIPGNQALTLAEETIKQTTG